MVKFKVLEIECSLSIAVISYLGQYTGIWIICFDGYGSLLDSSAVGRLGKTHQFNGSLINLLFPSQ